MHACFPFYSSLHCVFGRSEVEKRKLAVRRWEGELILQNRDNTL